MNSISDKRDLASAAHAGKSLRGSTVPCRLTAGLVALLGMIVGVVGDFDPATAGAAEIQIRRECYPARPIVTLGDLAEIIAVDDEEAARLAALELFPSPAIGLRQQVKITQVQDYLMLRGEDLGRHRFSGYASTLVCGPQRQSLQSANPGTIRRAERRVSEAIVEYLCGVVRAEMPWEVEVSLSDEHVAMIESAEMIRVHGGEAPWTGSQHFTITTNTSDAIDSLQVSAKVSAPDAIVVAARTLARGQVINGADVVLQVVSNGGGQGDMFGSIDAVVGKEVISATPAGRPIQSSTVRAPILVSRGSVVTVSSRCAGIVVRTEGRAREEGAMGDLVAIESFTNRKIFHARVSGDRQVEVLAFAPRAMSDASQSPAGPSGHAGWGYGQPATGGQFTSGPTQQFHGLAQRTEAGYALPLPVRPLPVGRRVTTELTPARTNSAYGEPSSGFSNAGIGRFGASEAVTFPLR